MSRPSSLVIAFVAALCAAAPLAAWAAPSPHIAGFRMLSNDDKKDQPQAKNGGTVDGQVVAIDYRASTMAVQAGSKRLQIHVLPSTNIQGPGNAFHTIADIQKGAHVRVMLSQVGSTYNAQLIDLH